MNLYKFLLYLALLWCSGMVYGPLHAQQPTKSVKPDTINQVTALEEVQILAKRVDKFSVGSRITSLDSSALKSYKSGNLSDILQFYLPVYLKTYGSGMLSSIAFRGTSASHTAVLWNGFSIIQPANGQTDFSLIPIFSVDAIDIQHGNASTNYGSGAIGGSILLTSPVQFGKGFSAAIQQTLGSFGRYITHLLSGYSTSKLFFQTKLFHHQAQNDFPFINLSRFGKPTEKQVNSAIKQYGLNQEAGIWLTSKNLLTFRGWYNYSHRQIPPAMGSANRKAAQVDENLRLATEWNHFSKMGNTSIKMAFFNENLQYTEDQLHSHNRIQTIQSQAEHEYVFKENLLLKAGIELQHFYAQVDGYGETKRESRASTFLLSHIQVNKRLTMAINFRQAFVQGFNPPFTPTAGIKYHLLSNPSHQLVFKGNVARSYRVPTLNERYWQAGGNPAIRPEKSWSYENGLFYKWNRPKVALETEITGYVMNVDDWIQWLPTEQGYWSPVNVMQVHPKGIEFTSRLKFTTMVHGLIGTSYAYTSSTVNQSYGNSLQDLGKQLMYVPLHTGILYGNLHYQSLTIGANVSYTGYRYTNNSNTSWLDSFMLLNVSAAKSISWHRSVFQLQGRINNLTNTIYQNMENRPMPGRNIELSLRYEFHKQP